MKYAMLVYTDQSAWTDLSDEEAAKAREESMPGWNAVFGELSRVDPAWDGKELDAAVEARTVRVRDGQTLVTDGPFAETKEQIGGLFVTDLADLDEAIRLASLIPAASDGSIEIRPLVEH